MDTLDIVTNYIIKMAPYLIFGFLIAGIINEFVSKERIQKSFGSKGMWGVVKASALGIPLPLCSCAVIPTAVTIKKNGATNASTSSFLISTPESGIDSIFATYALMDLPMTIIRPVAAFLSAFFAGFLQLIFNPDQKIEEEVKSEKATSCCSGKTCSSSNQKRNSLAARISRIMKFSFFELIDDMVLWLTFGIVAGVIIEVAFPANYFANLSGGASRFIILLIGIPLYICASASTPIAASLISKGMSPGVALVFLLVGPATNISNIFILKKYIGMRGILINVFAIAVVAIVMSYAVDYFYLSQSLTTNFQNTHSHLENASWFEIALSVLFVVLLLRSLLFVELPKQIKNRMNKKSSSCCG